MVEGVVRPRDLVFICMDLPRRRLLTVDRENARKLAEAILAELEVMG